MGMMVYSKVLEYESETERVTAKAYAVFNYSESSTMYRAGFGQKMMLTNGSESYGWYCAYIALDREKYKDNSLLKDVRELGYPELTVYGDCTFYDSYVPSCSKDVSAAFGDRALLVAGWDYNHGYSSDWSPHDEHSITLVDIENDIETAWREIKEGQPAPPAPQTPSEESGCTLDQWFDKVEVNGKDIFFLKDRTGDPHKVLPVLFCPFCGKPLYKEDGKKE